MAPRKESDTNRFPRSSKARAFGSPLGSSAASRFAVPSGLTFQHPVGGRVEGPQRRVHGSPTVHGQPQHPRDVASKEGPATSELSQGHFLHLRTESPCQPTINQRP